MTTRPKGAIVTPPALLSGRRFVRDGEVDLAFEDIDARHENAQLIAHGKFPAGLPANESPLGRVKNIEVVRERRNVDEAGQEHVRQFEQEPIIPDIDDRRAKDLRVARVQLALKEFELFHFHGIHLGLAATRSVIEICSAAAAIWPMSARHGGLVALRQRSMDDQVGIPPDWAGEVM